MLHATLNWCAAPVTCNILPHADMTKKYCVILNTQRLFGITIGIFKSIAWNKTQPIEFWKIKSYILFYSVY